jgi:DNA-directed RNA polymerase specialized sigma24 family protein
MVPGTITGWIDRLKAGDRAAASPLWETYFRRLVQFARERLRGVSRRVADEEDAALSAFDSFCSAAAGGRFPRLADRRSLWPLLAALTRHKCVDLVRRESRRKRGGDCGREDAVEDLATREPPPDIAAEFADDVNVLLTRLAAAGDQDLLTIALARLNGERSIEIAARLGCARRSVERKLAMIARIWAAGEKA